jgi:hypothetical protein
MWKGYTVQLHLFGLIGTRSYTDMQKIRIIELVSENRLHWQFEVEKISINGSLSYKFIYAQVNINPLTPNDL